MLVLSVERVIKDIISRRDPSGNYVIVALNNDEAIRVLANYSNLLIEESGPVLIVKCKSRRVAEEIARKLLMRRLLVTE